MEHTKTISLAREAPFEFQRFRETGVLKDLFKNEEIEDILFVITYSGITPEWPSQTPAGPRASVQVP